MSIERRTPTEAELPEVIAVLREWQRDDAPIQLHPGDLGWYGRLGSAALAEAVRVWRQDGEVLAVGLLDGPEVLRLTVAPSAWRDDVVSDAVVDAVSGTADDPLAAVAAVETPDGTGVRDALAAAGWSEGEAWTPLRLDLTDPVPDVDLRIDVVDGSQVSAFTAVHRSAWDSDRFTDETWQVMADGPAFADARCLLGRDRSGAAVAGVTVWPAGPGRPALLEPLGVHAEHRGRGYARSICVAAAGQLRAWGASSVVVCTPSSLTGAVATYRAAGFADLPQRLDRTRPAADPADQ